MTIQDPIVVVGAGLMGTGIDMLPGELHEAAFRRFCEQDIHNKYGPSRVKFLGPA